MIVEYKTDFHSLEACLAQFLELAGAERWKKRTVQLSKAAIASPFQAKIIADYHWLELVLSHHIDVCKANDSLTPRQVTIELFSALLFVKTVVSVHRQLSTAGRRLLEGRLRSALRAETGFAPLYVEMSVARRLFDAGYEVEFSDIEGLAQFDLRFWKGSVHGEVECKSLSCDAGRKVHRKDFYRFMDTMGGLLESRARSGAKEVLLVTLHDRMPASLGQQRALSEAAKRLLSQPNLVRIEGEFFAVTLEAHDPRLELALATGQHEAYRLCREMYGNNCHVSGSIGPDGACLVIIRSQDEDDPSGAILDAMKKATSQFSKTRPAFIAVQFEDIEPSDLLLHDLRRRAGLLSYYLFRRAEASHVAASYFCAYGGLVVSEPGVGEPAFAVPNPMSNNAVVAADYVPFLGHVPDAEFARLLGEPSPLKSISNIPIDKSGPESEQTR